MTVVRVRAKTIYGREIVGPIMGNGGMIGSGSLHAGIESAKREARRRLELVRRRAEVGLSTSIYEPKPGHLAIYPDFCGAGDGEPVVVPIVSTVFTVE